LAQALVEGVLRFGVGARVWLDEIKQVGNVDDTAALFSESTGRVLVSVGREDDVKFVGLCEARGIPVLRIGVTDGRAVLGASGSSAASTGAATAADSDARLEIQGVASWSLAELAGVHEGTLPELFG
jgi:phosphoribosylformylglycinamidine synthase